MHFFRRHLLQFGGSSQFWNNFWWMLCYVANNSVGFVLSAGAGRTGTFIALSNILERVKAEGLLDVFQTVKSLRMQRPHMVQTVVSAKKKEKEKVVKNVILFIVVFFGIGPTCVHSNASLFVFSFQEQYDFCYRVVQDFIDIFSDYANFK